MEPGSCTNSGYGVCVGHTTFTQGAAHGHNREQELSGEPANVQERLQGVDMSLGLQPDAGDVHPPPHDRGEGCSAKILRNGSRYSSDTVPI